jgi:hypothetical protein
MTTIKQFDALANRYQQLALLLDGRGNTKDADGKEIKSDSQRMLDKIYKEMVVLAQETPALRSQLPKKIQLYNDGHNGMIKAVQDAWRGQNLLR